MWRSGDTIMADNNSENPPQFRRGRGKPELAAMPRAGQRAH